MKKLLLMAALALSMPLVTQAAYFLPDLTNVGELDTFKAEAAKVNNPDNEALWVQGVLGDPTVDWTVSVLNVSYQETTTSGVWAFALSDNPEYYLIKNSNRMALFANVIDLSWAVFAQSDLSSGLNIGTSGLTISHVTSLNGNGNDDDDDDDGGGGGGGNNKIPEPKGLSMIGLGLVGLAGIRKTVKIL